MYSISITARLFNKTVRYLPVLASGEHIAMGCGRWGRAFRSSKRTLHFGTGKK
jgi:hypothetical protein